MDPPSPSLMQEPEVFATICDLLFHSGGRRCEYEYAQPVNLEYNCYEAQKNCRKFLNFDKNV